MDPTKMPGEYAAIGDLDGPDDFVPADVVATAAVAGAIFGVGGGEELKSALALQAARKRFGRRRGERVWRDFRSVDDPEGPTDGAPQALPLRAATRAAGAARRCPDRGIGEARRDRSRRRRRRASTTRASCCRSRARSRTR